MKKIFIALGISAVVIQMTNAQSGPIEFLHSNWGQGFGSKIYGVDDGIAGKTSLRIAVRSDSKVWNDALYIRAGANNGVVGINTVDPIARFEVFGGALGTTKGDYLPIAAFTSKNANHNKLIIKQIRWANSNDWTSASTRIQLDTDASPQGYIEFNSIPPSGVGSVSTHDYSRVGIALGHNSKEYFRMNYSNGYIGIGTNNPDEMLTVKGKIHAEEVKVDLQIPADYVFQKYYTGTSSLKSDYQLPTLQEVEQFTKENHHLPNVPSAKEIQENGLQVGEMTNLLLQKIEELTLYTIEQEKRIQMLEAKLEDKN